jgi:hypothetical protein
LVFLFKIWMCMLLQLLNCALKTFCNEVHNLVHWFRADIWVEGERFKSNRNNFTIYSSPTTIHIFICLRLVTMDESLPLIDNFGQSLEQWVGNWINQGIWKSNGILSFATSSIVIHCLTLLDSILLCQVIILQSTLLGPSIVQLPSLNWTKFNCPLVHPLSHFLFHFSKFAMLSKFSKAIKTNYVQSRSTWHKRTSNVVKTTKTFMYKVHICSYSCTFYVVSYAFKMMCLYMINLK